MINRKKNLKNETSFRDLGNNIKHTNIHIIWVAEGKVSREHI